MWGSFSPITGDSHYFITDGVNKDLFLAYLEDLSLKNPKELKILLIDNAAFHSTKNVILPDNIKLIPIPPYSPELNPAEKIWQYLKDKIAMKIFDNLKKMENYLIESIKSLDPKKVIDITSFEYITNSFYSIFN